MRYISEIIDCRCREIIEAVLYYLQESGLQNSLRSGVVVTGGGAELTNFIPLFKEMSGYEVRKGYPRFMFSASVGSGVYSTTATAAIGMVLSAKDDRLPDCVSLPEKEEAPEEELIEMEVEVEEVQHAADGQLFSEDELGPRVAAPKEKKKKERKTVKVPKKEGAGFMGILWKTVRNGAITFYEKANEE